VGEEIGWFSNKSRGRRRLLSLSVMAIAALFATAARLSAEAEGADAAPTHSTDFLT